MIFEWPKGIYKQIPYTFSDGTKGIWNLKKFNEDADYDFKERIKILDIAMGIERKLNEFIGNIFIPDGLTYFQFEEVILNRVNFEGKIDIFEDFLKNSSLSYLLLENKNFVIKLTAKNEIVINNFTLNINVLIKSIKEIKDIRNNSVHIYSPIFGKDTIFRRTNRHLGMKEYNKEEILIKGNFILWVLQLAQKENWIDENVLTEFYKKYEDILRKVAKLNEEG